MHDLIIICSEYINDNDEFFLMTQIFMTVVYTFTIS